MNRLVTVDEVAKDLVASVKKATEHLSDSERREFFVLFANWLMGDPWAKPRSGERTNKPSR